MKWHYSFTRKFSILNYAKLLKNLKKELIKYPINRAENKNKDYEIMDVNPMAVNEIFQKFKKNILIHGHTHRPKIHQEKYGTRYVLGDWEREFYFLKISETIEFVNEKID